MDKSKTKIHTPGEASSAGFTLIEIVITLAIIAIFVGVSVFMIDPARQFAKGRNDQRLLNINVILNAIGQNIADNTGAFVCVNGVIPTSTTNMSNIDYDVSECLVFEYLSILPVDPTTGIPGSVSTTTYNTRYSIYRNATTSKITITAPDAELEKLITVTR